MEIVSTYAQKGDIYSGGTIAHGDIDECGVMLITIRDSQCDTDQITDGHSSCCETAADLMASPPRPPKPGRPSINLHADSIINLRHFIGTTSLPLYVIDILLLDFRVRYRPRILSFYF